jgi:hypothetical protein
LQRATTLFEWQNLSTSFCGGRPTSAPARRMKALANGTAQLIDGDEVRRDGLALLRALRDE